MDRIQPKLSPGKGRWPKSPVKRLRREYLLKAGAEFKKAAKRRDGSQGAASPVRHIDPKTGEVITREAD
jgi:hypothetical protein